MPPFRYDAYDYGPTERMADLVAAPGRIQAQSALRSGAVKADLAQNLGGIANQTIATMTQERREAPKRALETRQIQDVNRQMNDADQVRQILKESGGNLVTAFPKLMAVSPEIGMKYRTALAEAQDAALKFQKSKLEHDTAQIEFIGRKLSSVTDQASYDQARVAIEAATDQDLPPQFNAGWVKARQQESLTAKERADQAMKRFIEEDPTKNIRDLQTGVVTPAAEVKKPTSAQEYEYAKTQGFTGSFEQYQNEDANRKRSTINVSGEGKFQWATDPKDGIVRLMSVDEIRKMGGQQPPTSDMRNKVAGRSLVEKSINAIQDLSVRIISKIGPAQRVEAVKRGLEATFGNDPEFRTYQDARTALAGNLAVAQQGSRPSDADIKAIWLPLVPDAYRDTSASAKMKWDLIRTMSSAPPSEGGLPAESPQKIGRFDVVVGP